MNSPRTGKILVALLLLAAALANAFEMVVIDPGHGGNDEGTAWYHVREKDVTLAVAQRLEKILRDNGIQAILTRDTDTYVSLDERAEIANRHPRSLLLSIHFNCSSAESSNGFSTYYFSQSPSGRFVAQTVQDALDESLPTRNRGTRPRNYAVLVRTAGSAVLVECGFLSNKAEAAQSASAEGQQWLAETLALGVIRAKPVIISDPPECELAKCEVYAKHLEEKERKGMAAAAPIKRTMPPKPHS
ncbi:MAG: N-acetylmuramoyl-L-alanine amidase, partial [Chthoniobacteraceae bacterium]